MRFSCRKLSVATWRVSNSRDGDGVEIGLQRSAKSTFHLSGERWWRSDLWLKRFGFVLFFPLSAFHHHQHHHTLLQDVGLGMLSSNRKCQTRQCFSNTFFFVGPRQKARWHFPEGPWAEPKTNKEPNDSFWCHNLWDTSLLSAGIVRTCHVILFLRKEIKKEEAKKEKRKVKKAQDRWWRPFIIFINKELKLLQERSCLHFVVHYQDLNFTKQIQDRWKFAQFTYGGRPSLPSCSSPDLMGVVRSKPLPIGPWFPTLTIHWN